MLKNKTLLAALLLSVLLGIFFYDVIFLGKVYLSADAQAARSVSLAIKDKTMFPQHFPYIFSGMPAIMVYTSPYLYFPNVLTTWLPAYDALYASHVLHYLLAGMGMFLLLRSYGFWSGIVGAISFMFTTNMIGQSVYGHAGLMMTAAYIPIIFWALRRCFSESGTYFRHWGIFALLLGLQMQRGHYQIIYYTWMFVGAFFVWNTWRIWGNNYLKESLKRLGMLIGCGILAFGMDAMITFPTMEYAKISIRSDIDFSYASSWSFHLKEMITFLLPNFYGFSNPTYTGYLPFTHFPNYLGVVTVILACFARGRMVKFLIGVIGAALLISFGKYTPIYEFLYDYLPLFDTFRAPMMILILVQFSVALLAGVGFKRVQDYLKSMPLFKNVDLKFIVLIVLADLWFVGYKINKTHDLQDLRKTDEIVEFFKKQDGVYRVAFVSPPFNQSNIYAVHGIETVGGYHAAKLKIYQENFLDKDITTESLSYLNVVFIVSKKEIKELQLVGTAEGMNIYLNRNLLSRYFLSGVGNISVLDRGIEYAKLRVTLNELQTLIFSEIYCPSWKVYVDGVKVENEIWRNLLCSIQLEPGEYLVELKYESSAFAYGAGICFFSVGIIGFLIIKRRLR